MSRIWVYVFACVLPMLGMTAHAQTVPVPISKQSVMAENTADYEREQARQKDLMNRLEAIDDEIEGLRRQMIRAARDVQAREKDLSNIEDRIDELQIRRTELLKKLQKDHKDIAGLTQALIRLRRVPPEALLARPGAPIDTAHTAMILQHIMEPLQNHAVTLQQDLLELASLEADLRERQATLKIAATRILTEQTKLADLVRRREAAYRGVQTDLAAQERDLARLAEDAANFKELLGKLEERNQALQAAPSNPQAPRTASLPPRLDRKILKTLGDIQMPLSGVIRVGFGTVDDMGSESQGLRIEGRAGSIVVAPMNGVIRYQGRFKHYGNMVIIEHGKNYHSLVAGLAKIDTVVGQSVEAGEPLGSLGAARAATRPTLYYELRQNGKPTNPTRLFADLG